MLQQAGARREVLAAASKSAFSNLTASFVFLFGTGFFAISWVH
jgi:hypothetical protein